MNEVQVDLDKDGRIHLSRAGYGNGIYTLETTEALRAFFQAERDEALGRWRDPQNPDYVVYQVDRESDFIRVLNECTGEVRYTRKVMFTASAGPFLVTRNVARRYFAAHPEPKPWNAAQPDEIWVLTDEDRSEVFRCGENGLYSLKTGDPLSRLFPILTITSGRRIWPEEDK